MSPENSAIGGDQSVEALRRELAAAREQQSVTAEILRVISSSPMDLQRVFAEIATSAARLCDAYDAVIRQVDGEVLRLVAHHGPLPTPATLPLSRSFLTARAVLDRRTIHHADLQAEGQEYPEGSDVALRLGHRAMLAVPLIRAGNAIGAISIRRTEVRPFTDREVDLLKTFADQAVIAIENTRLFEEVQARTRDLTEALEYQTAISGVLSIIGRSKFDLQPVLDALIESAAKLCAADQGGMVRKQGSTYVTVANYGHSLQLARFLRASPFEVGRDTISGRVILEGRTIQVGDVLDDPELDSRYRVVGSRTILGVPLLREGAPIGVLVLARRTVRPFTDKQIELVSTFADQAVIAIENTRLFEAEQASKRELQESLEYQTATSEVLGVISRSPDTLQPVLDGIVATALRLCDARNAAIVLKEGDVLRLRAKHGPMSMRTEWPVGNRSLLVSRAIHDCRTQHIHDLASAGDEFPEGQRDAIRDGIRSILAVPLVREERSIGTIVVRRTEVKPFTARQISLLQTFADQAVIAINNVGLFEEVQARTKQVTEALEYETAISEVLSVISKSPNELKPVLDAITKIASRLCESEFAALFNVIGDRCYIAAANNANASFIQYLKDNPVPVEPASAVGMAAFGRKTFHVEDVLKLPNYTRSDSQKVGGQRTVLSVPLLRDGQAVGVIALMRSRVEGFTEKQIKLVETFADQAVIAIENTRLFEEVQTRTRELSEALEYQTATSDVLNVISRSKFDLQPVLDSIVQTAARLCACDMATIRRREGDVYVQLAAYGLPDEYAEFSKSASWHHAGRGSLVGRVLQEGKAVQIPDVVADPEYTLGEAQRRGGFRSTLGVPLLRGADQIGIVVLMRRVVQPFSDKQVELVTAFADQAVIAIENTRLFEEVQARTAELAKTVEDLEIASQHKSQFVANMSHELRTPLAAMLGYAELLQEGIYGTLPEKFLPILTRIRSNGNHLLGLINTVLDIAKIESGQFTLNMSEYAIESVVETVRAATESLAQNKKLTLTTSVDKSLPIGLGDEQRLTQVLLNLVGNAIKFTDAGEVRIAATTANGHFAVSVADTGPGIPQEHQARIFEQFHQVDSSNTKVKGGTGLGLAIAREIVEMHGGRIWVESTLGQGSTFRMELPVRATVAGAAA